MILPNQSTSIKRTGIKHLSTRMEPGVQASTHQWFHVELPLQSVNRPEVLPYHNPIYPSNPYYCYGWDDVTNSCKLYLGSKQFCDNITPCPWTQAIMQLPGTVQSRCS